MGSLSLSAWQLCLSPLLWQRWHSDAQSHLVGTRRHFCTIKPKGELNKRVKERQNRGEEEGNVTHEDENNASTS